MIAIDPKAYNHPDRQTLHEGDVGQLGNALLAVTRELYVLTDRLAVLEAVLGRHGIEVSEQIEAFEPDQDMQRALDARGEQMVANVLNALGGIAGVGLR